MNLIDLSIKRPVFAWILMSALIIFGAISANRLGISQLPDVDFPVLSISLTYEGAAPEVIEAELLDPLEERLLVIEGIKEMKSSARQGQGNITLEFDINRNVDVALQEVQSAISQFRLPAGVDPAVVRKTNPEEEPIIIISVFGEVNIKEVLVWADTFMLDQLRFIPGVGEVGIGGFSQRNLRVWLKPDKLEANFLTISDVVEALRSQHIESAAGQFSDGKRELRVRWLGEAAAVEDVANLQILKRGGQIIHDRIIYIKDVADVEDGLSDIRRIARVNGKGAMGVLIRKQRGTNEVEVAKAVRAKLDEVKDRFPKGLEYRVNIDFTKPTEATVALTKEKLWVAGVITILVCFLFLGSLQAAVNILFSIPVSIFGTFIILYFSGFTLNTFTLLALTLAISIVVDDAIMLLENIVRHYRMGKSPIAAASEGSKEVLPAAIAASLAVVAVFIPVIFMDGIVGKFFFQFGITMSAAVLLSLLEAVTITPMRSAAFLSTKPSIGRFEIWLDHLFDRWADVYRKLLQWTLDFRFLVVILSFSMFFLSLFLIKKVKQEFVPPQDQNFIIVVAQTPPSSSLEKTDEEARKIEEILRQDPDVEGFFVSVGAGGPSSQINQIFMPVSLKPREQRQAGHLEIMDRWRAKFKESLKGTRVNMRDISARNLTSGRLNPVAISLRGPDLKVLSEKSQELMKKLEEQNLAVDLDTDFRLGVPELVIRPDREAMALRGVSAQAVGELLAAGVGGVRQGRYTSDGRRYDIRFKIRPEYIQKPEDIRRLFVRNNTGNLISLRDLVQISEQPSTLGINRINRQRAVAVFGNLAPGQSQARVLNESERIMKEILPTGYSYEFEGVAAGFGASFKSFTTALLIGILVAYMILAVQFNSFIHPVSILMALPFSVTGALLALWLFGVSLNLFSFIGLIVLMGIAKKNSIMLVEFTTHLREEGRPLREALLTACPIRLRPILMTSVATIAAALPLVVGTGFGHEIRTPMGLSIIGGTLVSTLLTLFVIPAIYMMLSHFEGKKRETV